MSSHVFPSSLSPSIITHSMCRSWWIDDSAHPGRQECNKIPHTIILILCLRNIKTVLTLQFQIWGQAAVIPLPSQQGPKLLTFVPLNLGESSSSPCRRLVFTEETVCKIKNRLKHGFPSWLVQNTSQLAHSLFGPPAGDCQTVSAVFSSLQDAKKLTARQSYCTSLLLS